MKKFFVDYHGFGNCYSLFWADTKEMEENIPTSARKITRKEAISLCAAENKRKKNDPSFAYFADSTIFPAIKREIDVFGGDAEFKLNGYIWERK